MAAPPRDTSVVLYEFYGLPHHADDLSLAGHLVQRLSDAVATWGPELAVLGERAPLWEEPGAVDSLPAPQGDIPQTYLALAAESPREGCEYAEVVLYRAHDVMGIQLLVYSAARDADELRTLADAWLPEAKPADDTAAVLLGRTTLVHYVVDDEPSDAEDAARPSPGELHVATRAGGLSVTDDSPGRREYLLLTPKSLEDAAAAVVQWSGRPDQLHLFPALEMSRCKTAYEASEYAAAKTTLAVTERKLSQLRRETVHGDMGGRGRMADLLRECVDEPRGRGARALTESLCHLISVHGGLAGQLSWLDDLARSIEVNSVNFERAATALRAGPGDEADLFAQDAAVMQQQLEQLSTDMGYRRSVAARASHAVDSARAQLELLRSQAEAEVAELASVEASLIAALGIGFALFQVTQATLGSPLTNMAAALLGAAVVFGLSRLLLGAGSGALAHLISRLTLAAIAAAAAGVLWAVVAPGQLADGTKFVLYLCIVILPTTIAALILKLCGKRD